MSSFQNSGNKNDEFTARLVGALNTKDATPSGFPKQSATRTPERDDFQARLSAAMNKVTEGETKGSEGASASQAERGSAMGQPAMPDDLATVVEAWPSLPEAVKRGIVKMAQAHKVTTRVA